MCDKINLIYKKSIDDGTIGWQPWNASLLDNDTYQSTVDIFFEGIPKTARHLGILYRYPSRFEDWTDRQIKHAMDSYLADLRVESKVTMKYWAMVNTMAHMAEGATKISISSMVKTGQCVQIETATNYLTKLLDSAGLELKSSLSDAPLRAGSFDNFQVILKRLGLAGQMIKGTVGFYVRPRIPTFVKGTILHNNITKKRFSVREVQISTPYFRLVAVQVSIRRLVVCKSMSLLT